MDATLLLSGGMALGASVAYGALGVLLWRRPHPHPRHRAWQAYAAWWMGVSGLLALSGVGFLLAAWGFLALPIHLVHAHVERLLLMVALWCVMAYLTYLQLGHDRLWGPLAAFYALLWLQMTYGLLLSEPTRVLVEPWARPHLDAGAGNPLLASAVRLQIFLPPIVAALLHLRLVRFASRGARRRVLAASAGVAAWFILPTLAWFHPDQAWLQVLARLVVLGVGLALLWIYAPVLRAAAAAQAGTSDAAREVPQP